MWLNRPVLAITASPRWQQTFPGGCVGILEMAGIDQSHAGAALESRKRVLEAELRAAYSNRVRQDILALPVMAAYAAYYRQFKKTYHVLLQLESVAQKDKSLPAVAPLVDAAFITELETGVLTASHDVARLLPPLIVDATSGTELFTQMNGTARTLRPGDMCMADATGVICTIIYGQDSHSPVTPATTHVLYVAYAPAGVGQERTREHLEKLRDTVLLVDSAAVTQQLAVFKAPEA